MYIYTYFPAPFSLPSFFLGLQNPISETLFMYFSTDTTMLEVSVTNRDPLWRLWLELYVNNNADLRFYRKALLFFWGKWKQKQNKPQTYLLLPRFSINWTFKQCYQLSLRSERLIVKCVWYTYEPYSWACVWGDINEICLEQNQKP